MILVTKTSGTFNMPNSGCGKEERRLLIDPWRPAKAYLKAYWPCTGGLSAVNAIGTQPDKLGTDPMAYYGGFT